MKQLTTIATLPVIDMATTEPRNAAATTTKKIAQAAIRPRIQLIENFGINMRVTAISE